VVDDAGNPVVGACFAPLGASDVGRSATGDDSDADQADGVLLIEGIVVGEYSLTQTSAPRRLRAADQPVTIVADETAEVTVVSTADAPATGQVRILSVDAEGEPAGGGSYASARPRSTTTATATATTRRV
jgi:uncharacterized surface anchored protein